MKRLIRRILVLCIMIILGLGIYEIFFKTTTKGDLNAHTYLLWPEWVEDEITTSSFVRNADSGPIIKSDEDIYGAFALTFYDANTRKSIKDQDILEELLSMFQYTEEPFVYDRERSRGGDCFFYYDGILPADYSAALFSGFEGKTDFPRNEIKKIERVYMKFRTYSVSVSDADSLEQALDEF